MSRSLGYHSVRPETKQDTWTYTPIDWNLTFEGAKNDPTHI